MEFVSLFCEWEFICPHEHLDLEFNFNDFFVWFFPNFFSDFFPPISFINYAANIISICHGISIGWLSPNILTLKSEDTPLISGPMTISQTSWLASSIAIGAIIGNCLFGVLSTYIGQRNTLCSLALPNVVSCCMKIGRSFPALRMWRSKQISRTTTKLLLIRNLQMFAWNWIRRFGCWCWTEPISFNCTSAVYLLV